MNDQKANMLLMAFGWFLFFSYLIPIIRCRVGIHYLNKYPFKTREIGSHTSYEHYWCHRCKKEVIK